MYDGIINVYKEKGYTSHDVVAKMRGILRIKRIGHTGTLDPDAEGVLPVCVGKGTKLADMLTDRDKTYIAVGKLGMTTDTQDISGRVLKISELRASLPRLQEAAESFIGEYRQLPPMYSAIKVEGRRLYELARKGIEIERERRPVTIRGIRILDFDEEAQEFTVAVDCGKGTYIRTLLHDIGDTLGCGCTMKSLVRTAVGQFSIEQSLRLSEIEELVREDRLSACILTVDQVFEGLPGVILKQEYDKLVHNGNPFLPEQANLCLSGTDTRQMEKPVIDLQSDQEATDARGSQVQADTDTQDRQAEASAGTQSGQVKAASDTQCRQAGANTDTQDDLSKTFTDTRDGLATDVPGGQVRVYDSEEHFIGIYGYAAETGYYKPVKMF